MRGVLSFWSVFCFSPQLLNLTIRFSGATRTMNMNKEYISPPQSDEATNSFMVAAVVLCTLILVDCWSSSCFEEGLMGVVIQRGGFAG